MQNSSREFFPGNRKGGGHVGTGVLGWVKVEDIAGDVFISSCRCSNL